VKFYHPDSEPSEWRSLCPHPAQHFIGPPEPGTLAPPEVSRHCRFLCKNPLCPLTRLGFASLRFQKQSVMIIGLRDRRNSRGLAKHRIRPFALTGFCVSPRE